ncbi:YjgN family protein [Salipiger sp. P9]|uniref:YjgN family protein n=1 Tax=Salipiger pentaromativorans TaxID=2943193 RepID=UPI0021581637|nr:YjgN family protein [Salipiger pentaromativorans]MCR8549367.1 YjgN family protein [Salipiger pentaromativorans]
MSDGNYAHGDYTGHGKALFWLALCTGLLTLLTLGIYRFWAKTRIRRYIWSSARLDGSRFEYTGTGLEKFLGFLLAVVFLAVYLGLIQIVLFYFGLRIFAAPQTPEQALAQTAGFSVSALALMPFIFFAIYRARRYKLARSRWRGIRFGMDKAAWGYAFRALGYWLLTLISLGLLTPLMTFRLEKYMTDRSWFGDAQFEQQGRWTALYAKMKHIFIGLVLMALGGTAAAFIEEPASLLTMLAVLAIPTGLVWFVIGVISYRVQCFAYLTRHKMLMGKIAFHAQPRTAKVIGTYIVGSLILSLLLSVAVAVFGGIAALMLSGLDLTAPDSTFEPGMIPPIVISVAGYLLTLIAAQAGALALITQPILRHYVQSLTVINIEALAEIHQRLADPGADAEGFADALDIGGAI